MTNTSYSERKRHTHLDMSFLGCIMAFVLEVCFQNEIFIPGPGGASFALIALIIINFFAIPVVMLVTVLFSYIYAIPRNKLTCVFIFLLACVLTIQGVFIVYPVGQ